MARLFLFFAFCLVLIASHDSFSIPKGLASLKPPISKTLIAAGVFGGVFGRKAAPAGASSTSGATNEVVSVVNGIKHKRLGGGDIVVSEMGLGTQRWVSEDFNAPDKELCFQMMDEAILNRGINLVDTAEQYPIPSSSRFPEGLVETTIGEWFAKGKGRREKMVLATKITGGKNVKRKNIIADCDASLKRLGTDYIDIYLLHWPARYTPQSNWGQSLSYVHEAEQAPYYKGNADFEEICSAMGELIQAGKIRGYGYCNDNCYGLTASYYVAKALGVPPPCCLQNDYSLINRRIEENGVSEASSPLHTNSGFMAYNALAGGVLTGKYLTGPPTTYDNPSFDSSKATRNNPRGRHDEPGWSRTLYRYRSGPAAEATKLYAKIAEKYKMPLTELSLKWARQRRAVTTTLVGHTSLAQLEEDIAYYTDTKPLSPELLWEVDRVHMRNRLPIFSNTRVGEDWYGEGEIGERIP